MRRRPGSTQDRLDPEHAIENRHPYLHLLLPTLIAICAFAIHAEVLEMSLFGQDGYAAIIASRIQDFQDFVGTFSEVMMDDRLGVGDFYRPLGNLFLAADYSLWGMQARGYQLTSMLVWCASVMALYQLTRRLLGGGAWLGPSLAALTFASHPTTLSILPYPARRTETLMLLFVALALLSLAKAGGNTDRRPRLAAGLFALLAVASKETGIVAVLLIFLHQLIEVETVDPRRRIERAVSATAPAVVLCGLFLIGRSFVVGGIGGYHIGYNLPYSTKLLDFGPQYLATTFFSGAFEVADANTPLALSIVVALGAMVVWFMLQRIRATSALALASVWLATSIGLACASIEFSPRYMMPMTFSAAMLLGALAEGALRTLADGQLARRATGGLALAALAPIAWVAVNGSALVVPYPELRRATRIQNQLLETLNQRIESSAYEYIDLELTKKVPVAARAVDDVWMISPWSLDAWLELAHPDRRYQLSVSDSSGRYWSLTLNPTRSDR